MLKKLLPIALSAALCLPAFADEASVKKALETKLGAKITSVTKSPYLGLYEVYAEGQILYTDEKQSVIIAGGSLIDGKTMRNHTAERMQKLTAIKFNELPFEYAVKQVRGDGKRVMASFEDPNCGYCKKLAKELLGMKDVTIYTFLTPVLGPDSQKKAEAIWCSADRSKTWSDWMTTNVAPAAATASCDTAGLQRSAALGEKYRVRGTPTIFLSTGERIPGYVPVAQLEQRIANIK